jgi:hypothetical protein
MTPITIEFQSVGGDAAAGIDQIIGKLGQLTKGAAESIATAYRSFAQIQGQIQETAAILTSSARQWLALAAAGDRYGDVMGALKTDISQARAALNGMVDDMTLATAANRASQAGLALTGEQFRAAAVRAKEFADANGMEFQPAMEALVGVLIRGKDRFHQWNIEGDNSKEMIADLTAKYGDASAAIGGVTDATDALNSQWTNLTNKMGQAMDTNGPLTALASTLSGIVGWLQEGEARAAGFGSALTTGLLGGVGMLANMLDMARQFVDLTGDQDWRLAEGAVGGWDQASIDRATRLAQGHAAPVGTYTPEGAPLTSRTARPDRLRRSRGGGGGGGGADDFATGMVRGSLEAQAALASQKQSALKSQGDAEKEILEANTDATQAIIEDNDRWELANMKAHGKARAEILYAQRQREQDAEIGSQKKTLAAVSSYTSTFGDIIGQGMEEFGASKGAMAYFSAVETSVQAAIEWARSLVPYEGAAHVPAAIGLTAAAAFGFAKAAELGHHGAGSGGPSGAGSGAAAMGGGPTNNTYNINFQGQAFVTRSEVDAVIHESIVRSADTGRQLPRRAVGSR